jgi:hypothetical protein
MKILERINPNFEFEFLTNKNLLDELWLKTNTNEVIKLIKEDTQDLTKTHKMDTQDLTKTHKMDTQDLTKTQKVDDPNKTKTLDMNDEFGNAKTQDFNDTETQDLKPEFDKEKLKKLLILAYKTSSDNKAKTKDKAIESGYKTIMHLAKTIYNNIDQIKGQNQLNQVLHHIENGYNRYIEVSRSYRQFYNSLKNLSSD